MTFGQMCRDELFLGERTDLVALSILPSSFHSNAPHYDPAEEQVNFGQSVQLSTKLIRDVDIAEACIGLHDWSHCERKQILGNSECAISTKE